MRVVIQRVSRASVEIEGRTKGQIGKGLLLFAGVGPEDKEEDARWLASKITTMRIFEDGGGKMNLSVKDVEGDILLISQFTLYASTRKGNRPSFNGSAPPEVAVPLYDIFHRELTGIMGKDVPSGEFGAHMNIDLRNDGPVTIIMDSRERK
ncbi:D-aminoacyl-tRNA deacylase [Spirochaeta isovalerica]|uniref:D-aminoacyl-tRNA deacylase n=1 Tax=Spirochaeta isovalerica TaxID=150 RepID=A0A841RCY8_9SPIO|nr:D-aminoacyl-tRNA deacylase [Spirochaeta isovalerica]MBB6480860.1 D-tyrosyl-tRNA(Tyr) deacylase [Spirochaeta isovalerica]